MNTSSINKAGNLLQRHITKCVTNNNYAAKALLFTSIGISAYSNILDSIQIGKNKEIHEDERKYLSAFKLTEAFVSTAAQATVGLAILSRKTQGFLIKQVSKLGPKIAETLKKSAAQRHLMKFSSLIGAVVLTKRVLVPFITTPLASAVKKRKDEKVDKIENIFESSKHNINFDKDDD